MIMKIKKISINGKIYEPQNAKIDANDHALTRGVAAFETFRISNNRIFLFSEHISRLKKSLSALGVDWQIGPGELASWMAEISKCTGNEHDGQLRLMVTGGVKSPQTIIYLYQIDKFKASAITAKVSKDYHRQKPEYFTKTGFRIKTIDYAAYYMASAKNGDTKNELILLSPEGFVAETFTANIFWSKRGKIYTPPLALGILAGVTRAYIKRNFAVEEKLITESELESADEIWLSSSVKNLRPLSRINSVLKPGLEGSIFTKINDELIRNIAKQATDIHKL